MTFDTTLVDPVYFYILLVCAIGIMQWPLVVIWTMSRTVKLHTRSMKSLFCESQGLRKGISDLRSQMEADSLALTFSTKLEKNKLSVVENTQKTMTTNYNDLAVEYVENNEEIKKELFELKKELHELKEENIKSVFYAHQYSCAASLDMLLTAHFDTLSKTKLEKLHKWFSDMDATPEQKGRHTLLLSFIMDHIKSLEAKKKAKKKKVVKKKIVKKKEITKKEITKKEK